MNGKYYRVSFQYSEATYCSNIAHAESIQAVYDHYNKYSWVNVEEATESDVQEAERKGKPIVEIESTPDEAETASTAGQPESVKVLAGFDGKFERIARTFATVEEAKKALDKAFGKSINGIWTDSHKQQFTINRDHKKQPETDEAEIMTTAERIYNLDIFGNRDNDITPERIKTYIESDPIETIIYLLDIIDDMQRG